MVDAELLQTVQIVSQLATALGVCIAAIYYVLNLRVSQRNAELSLKQQQTLETRQAQMFNNIYDKITEKELIKSWSSIMSSNWSNYQEFTELRKNPEWYDAFLYVNGTFEGIGVLVKEGILDIRWVALMITSWTTAYWEKIRDAIYEHKRVTGSKRLCSEYEYLYNELLKYLEKHSELKI